jgi:hypothetical protein
MTNIEDKCIPICCVCNKIRISDNPQIWLAREEDEKKYNNLIEGKKFTHGYCPEDYEKTMRALEEDVKTLIEKQ